jgi:hypothetical protein
MVGRFRLMDATEDDSRSNLGGKSGLAETVGSGPV